MVAAMQPSSSRAGMMMENTLGVCLEACAAGLAVAAVGECDDFEAGAELVAEAVEDFEGVVGGVVAEAGKDEVFDPVFDFFELFELSSERLVS